MYEIKKNPEDFKVEEITPEKKTLEIDEDYSFDENTEGDQLICNLVKRDWEQNKAIKKISNVLHSSRKRIGYAGTKDKRALTSQRVSIYGADPDQIKKIKIKDMKIKPLRYSEERVTLGDLWGNRFTIKVETDQETELEPKEKIPNYFGHQRFGKTRPITHLVGEAIIREDPEKSVKIYLTKVFKEESEEAKIARKWLKNNWEEKPFKKALKKYPDYLGYERTLLHHLAEYPKDFINALRKLPKNLQLMFPHAYQSHLFNQYLDKVRDKDIRQEKGPIYGYETEIKNEYEKEVLEENNLELKDFKVKCLPEMSEEGERRKLYIDLKDFEVLEESEDHYLLRFSLPKGSYATVVLDELLVDKNRKK